MRSSNPIAAFSAVVALAPILYACQQQDQTLPFELVEGAAQSVSLGVGGGLVTVPPSFSIEFREGSLPGSTTVDAAVRLEAFPTGAGAVVPESTYDVGPHGLQLGVPARVQVAISEALVPLGDEVRLALALLRPDGSLVTQVTSYDLATGILTADVSELGPMAVVVAADAIAVQDGTPPALGGGAIAPPAPAPAPSGSVATSHGGVEFSASCSPDARQCWASGIVQIWVDDLVRERLGEDLVLLNTTVESRLDFFDFDLSGHPTQLIGSLLVHGELRAALGSVVAGREVGEEVAIHTGAGVVPEPTAVTFSGNVMFLSETSEGPGESLGFGVVGIGTGEQITILLEGDLEFENIDGPPSYGTIWAQVRLRK